MLRLGESIRRCGIALLLLLSLCPLQSAHAVIGTLDNVPAATLLYPYFEVDLSNATGKTTVIGVHNTSATAILVRATIWSNTGVPLYDFNIYLTGYDSQSFDMRDILVNGVLPQTASAGQDPTDTISPHGPLSQDINFASCTGQLPYSTPIVPAFRTELQNMLTGKASVTEFPGQCVGTNAGDNIARGYLTMDTVNSCTSTFIPTSIPLSTYFDGNIFMTEQNVLLGDYMLINQAQHVLTMNNAAAIEADNNNPQTTTSGLYTFYGRFVNWTATDRRESLPTEWNVSGDTGSSSMIAWRDPKVSNPGPFSCATGKPNWAPLGQGGTCSFQSSQGLCFFDRAGIYTPIPTAPTASNPSPPPLPNFAPVATQVVPLNNTAMLLPPVKMGLLDINLNTTVAAAGPVPPVDPTSQQSLIVLLNTNENLASLSSGLVATPIRRTGPNTMPALSLSINPNGQLADGTAQDVATVTLVDASNGNPIASTSVNISVAFGPTLSANSCMTDGTGQCSVNITSNSAGSYAVGASALGASAISQNAVFNALAPDATKSKLAIITDNQKADGNAQDVAQVTLEDMNGTFENAVLVTFSAVGPVNFVSNTCTTNAAGQCTVGIRTTTPGSYAISVTAPVAVGPQNATFLP
jgi:hypothetical protein